MAAAAAYWRVLKAVHKHVGSGASRQHFRDFVAAEFRAPTGTEADAKERLQLAGDYLTSSPASTSTRRGAQKHSIAADQGIRHTWHLCLNWTKTQKLRLLNVQ
ncbi:uncharacterized protein [Miscanthus floridulus]|uniref:uncharacterized protein isoform X1 n=1 Tax=Miscanthus floridulus TaxID=154761 RepID=UPI003457465D